MKKLNKVLRALGVAWAHTVSYIMCFCISLVMVSAVVCIGVSVAGIIVKPLPLWLTQNMFYGILVVSLVPALFMHISVEKEAGEIKKPKEE